MDQTPASSAMACASEEGVGRGARFGPDPGIIGNGLRIRGGVGRGARFGPDPGFGYVLHVRLRHRWRGGKDIRSGSRRSWGQG